MVLWLEPMPNYTNAETRIHLTSPVYSFADYRFHQGNKPPGEEKLEKCRLTVDKCSYVAANIEIMLPYKRHYFEYFSLKDSTVVGINLPKLLHVRHHTKPQSILEPSVKILMAVKGLLASPVSSSSCYREQKTTTKIGCMAFVVDNASSAHHSNIISIGAKETDSLKLPQPPS
ncbi:hypothetical protein FF38_08560 [Lucilia cuprina]|uniref:Uncharacterized protein n=1 Tax=Lucilia cuprina TaxID=7375 RepID=A0A0L0CCD4_LUCCU|nr:hypothetical protein FF38_08560 [Lucilia cuprina]